jgi:hypothetical protein
LWIISESLTARFYNTRISIFRDIRVMTGFCVAYTDVIIKTASVGGNPFEMPSLRNSHAEN